MDGKAQQAMRDAHYDGAPGVLVSGLVWATAAVVCHALGVQRGVWTLLIGGVLISPLAGLVTRALGRSDSAPKGNPLTALAGASTVWLIVCCAMAFGLSLKDPAWFFPAMMATIGCRYMVFSTVFGRAAYWALGASLVAAGVGSLGLGLQPCWSAALGSLLELVFAVAIFRSAGPRAAA